MKGQRTCDRVRVGVKPLGSSLRLSVTADPKSKISETQLQTPTPSCRCLRLRHGSGLSADALLLVLILEHFNDTDIVVRLIVVVVCHLDVEVAAADLLNLGLVALLALKQADEPGDLVLDLCDW